MTNDRWQGSEDGSPDRPELAEKQANSAGDAPGGLGGGVVWDETVDITPGRPNSPAGAPGLQSGASGKKILAEIKAERKADRAKLPGSHERRDEVEQAVAAIEAGADTDEIEPIDGTPTDYSSRAQQLVDEIVITDSEE